MNISFDIDGVIYPWQMAIYEYVTNFHGNELPYEKFWNLFESIYSKNFIEYLLEIGPMYTSHFPKNEDIKVIKELAKEHEIFYISAITKNSAFSRYWWLKRFDFPYYDNFISTYDKRYAIVSNEIDFHLDDQKRNLLALKNFTNVVLFKQPWNKDIRDQFTCVSSIKEYKDVIENEKTV